MKRLILMTTMLLPPSSWAASTTDYNAIQSHITNALNLTGRAQQLEMDRAIRLTIRAYGLLPTHNGQIQMPRGTPQMDGFRQGGERQWLFTFDPSRKSDFAVTDAYGPVKGNPGNSDAMTAPNGLTIFWMNPSRIDPNALAFLIDHELLHFQYFTTPGKEKDLVVQHEVDIYLLQKMNLQKYGYTKSLSGIDGPYEHAEKHCDREIVRYQGEVRAQSTPQARAWAAVQAFRHRRGVPVYAEGRTVFVDKDKLEQIRRDAEALDTSIRESEARRRQELAPPPIAPAPPAALSVEEARRSYPTAAPETADVARTSFGRMIDAACDSDWASVSVDAYPRLTGEDLAILDASALQLRVGCNRTLLERLIAMRRSGVALDIDLLRAEVAAAQSSGTSTEIIESPSRKDERSGTGYNPCINDGNTCLRR